SEENHLIQGELFTWGLKVKNIDNKPTPIGKIIHYGIKNLDSNYYVSTSHEGFKTIRPLNPDEEVTILLDNDISYVEGALWVYAIIESQDNSIVFRNHQKKHYHDKYVYCWSGEESYNWIDGIYIQKKTELLQ
ncbi:hypothetical protein, partial [Aeromonas media]|uniref:hypothetical protein n=1 Tax=Aeromonas media TaxID=651 RepID=UPI003CFC29D8